MVNPDIRKLLSSEQGGTAHLQAMSATQLEARLKALKDAIRQAEGSSSDTQFHATVFKAKAGRKSYGAYGVSEQVQEVLEAEDRLRELLNLESASGEAQSPEVGGCPDNDPCADKKVMNLERLADMVFQRLMAEVRVERERAGWTV
jgi:hypothetical protein